MKEIVSVRMRQRAVFNRFLRVYWQLISNERHTNDASNCEVFPLIVLVLCVYVCVSVCC